MNTLAKSITLSFATVALLCAHCVGYSNRFVGKPQSLSSRLKWQHNTLKSENCPGYFVEDILDFSHLGLASRDQTLITADMADLQLKASRSVLTGHVNFRQDGNHILADKATVFRHLQNRKIKRIVLSGHVQLSQPGTYILSKRADLQLDKQAYQLDKVLYRLQKNHYFLWGQAQRFSQSSPGHYHMRDATITTCAPVHPSWMLHAKKFTVNQTTGTGQAFGATLYFHEHALLYSPYWRFSTDTRRVSGFLIPGVSKSTQSGLIISAPYYWNIAPNYDATFTPALYTKRGIMFSEEIRYLHPNGQGTLLSSILFNDRQFRRFRQQTAGIKSWGNQRAMLVFQDTHNLGRGFSSDINLHYVSDDYYLQDFQNDTVTVFDRQLPRRFSLHYQAQNWHAQATMLTYQTIQAKGQQTTAPVYEQLPNIEVLSDYPSYLGPVRWQGYAQYGYFHWPGGNRLGADGHRFIVQSHFDLPLHFHYGFVEPSLRIPLRLYRLIKQGSGLQSNINDVTPMMSVRAGLNYESDWRWGGHTLHQSIEPRIMYLYVPFHSQDALPLFDVGLQAFTYHQLFRDNRFSGIDRIGDANQLTLALQSQWEQEGGGPLIRMAVGAIAYFKTRNVSFCQGLNCSAFMSGTGLSITPRTTNWSPIASLLTVILRDNWTIHAGAAWDPEQRRWQNGHLSLQYRGKKQRILNLGATFLRNTLTQSPTNRYQLQKSKTISASGTWPLLHDWRLFTALSYNFVFHKPQNLIAGIQYDSCCWAIRLLGDRHLQSVDIANRPSYAKAVYLQFTFKGLGTLGNTDPSAVLMNTIPGYVDSFARAEPYTELRYL
jgi:LPS-assembly protein